MVEIAVEVGGTNSFLVEIELVFFLIRWKYHLLVEDVNCGWKAGGGNGRGKWGRLPMLNLDQLPRVRMS